MRSVSAHICAWMEENRLHLVGPWLLFGSLWLTVDFRTDNKEQISRCERYIFIYERSWRLFWKPRNEACYLPVGNSCPNWSAQCLYDDSSVQKVLGIQHICSAPLFHQFYSSVTQKISFDHAVTVPAVEQTAPSPAYRECCTRCETNI